MLNRVRFHSMLVVVFDVLFGVSVLFDVLFNFESKRFVRCSENHCTVSGLFVFVFGEQNVLFEAILK